MIGPSRTAAPATAAALLALALVWAPPVAAQVPGAILGETEISEGNGGFPGDLEDSDLFGVSVASLGDLDGDGVEDVAVGSSFAPNDFDGFGEFWVLFLNVDGTVKSAVRTGNDSPAMAGRIGRWDSFATSLAALGDVDGDGVTDLAVGAPRDDDYCCDDGSVWIVLLNADGTAKSASKISHAEGGLTTPLGYAYGFGRSVAALGDDDGDGVPDLAVGADRGAFGAGNTRGGVFILHLNADGTVKDETVIHPELAELQPATSSGLTFGTDVALLEDLDGDGGKELAISSRTRGVYVIRRDAAGGLVGAHKVSLNFQGQIVVGSSASNAAGFGQGVASLGDLDGDGVGDVLVGANGLNNGPGLAQGGLYILYLNPDGSLKASQEVSPSTGITGPIPDFADFGESLADLRRLDGDGIVDVLVGATGDALPAPPAGAAWVLRLDGAATARWSNLGFGVPGVQGLPVLVGQGSLRPGSAVSLDLSGAAPGAPAVLMVGFDTLYAPFGGGKIVPDVLGPHALFVLVTDPGGGVQLASTWPAAISGIPVVLQCWVEDATGPEGWAATHGLLAGEL